MANVMTLERYFSSKLAFFRHNNFERYISAILFSQVYIYLDPVISSILFTILLIIFGILPVSSIPIAIINYKINGLFLGYFSVLIAGTISSFIYYKFANYFILQFIKKRFKKKYLLLKKYSYLISEMTFLEFILLLFASVMSAAPKIKITRSEVLIASAGVLTLIVIIASVAASQH